MERFSDYYKRWMYGEGGYYRSPDRVGKKGDFYTSVSVSRLFGGAIAKQILKDRSFFDAGKIAIVEIGAEKGYLMADIIQTVYTLEPETLERLVFYTIEPIAELREAQRQYFKKSFGDVVKITVAESISEVNENQVYLVANELFDAFPCEVVKEGRMLYIDNGKRVFGEMVSEVKQLTEELKLNEGEVPLGYETFAQEIKAGFDKGLFMTFDYGEPEFRNRSSLRIFKGHEVDNFLDESFDFTTSFGQCDITYDVPFRYLVQVFEKAGWKSEGFYNQGRALVDMGITELLETVREKAGDEAYFAESNRMKMLISPAFLGERFKMVKFSF